MVMHLTLYLAGRTPLILIDYELEFLNLVEFWPTRLWEDPKVIGMIVYVGKGHIMGTHTPPGLCASL